MEIEKSKKRIAILGGGPSALFMYKRLVDAADENIAITIFEKKEQLGAGMPYSTEGAGDEHITNVSDNEIPEIVTSIEEWVQTLPEHTLSRFCINPHRFNEYQVLPRLLFGQYLAAQFDLLIKKAQKLGINTDIKLGTTVVDIIDDPKYGEVTVVLDTDEQQRFDQLVVCTGHNWPKSYEGKIEGYYDSPYPPSKIAVKIDHEVAIKGSSLTAIDAIRTLARKNGVFKKDNVGKISFDLAEDSKGFKLIMHSRNGLLPALRFHLEDSHLSNKSLLTKEDLLAHRESNNGFIAVDYIFDKDFKAIFIEKDLEFYQKIKDMNIEAFVEMIMDLRERVAPFQLLKAEYVEAEKSIKRKESIYWKEMLAVLSFAMNYPAKYLSAEDMLRLQKTLMPLISIVIAFVPQSSCKELLALYDAGLLDIVSVGSDSEVRPEQNGGVTYIYTNEDGIKVDQYFKTFIDCVGQPHLNYQDFPFKSLRTDKVISPAKLKFKDAQEGVKELEKGHDVEFDAEGNYYLNVSGIAINDNFNVVDSYGAYNERIFIMAVPYIGGYNPDYSGLDFCEAASDRIIKQMAKK